MYLTMDYPWFFFGLYVPCASQELENEFEQAHLNYLQNTDAKTEEFKKLTLCDQKATKEIER